MWQRGINISFYNIAHTLNVCVCACVPVMEEFYEHAFLSGIPGMTVVCLKKKKKRLGPSCVSDLDIIQPVI